MIDFERLDEMARLSSAMHVLDPELEAELEKGKELRPMSNLLNPDTELQDGGQRKDGLGQ